MLRSQVARLTCVEVDAGLAAAFRRRTLGNHVTVLSENATAMSLPDGEFDSAVCFTMLHHVPSPALPDRLLAEVARVLRPKEASSRGGTAATAVPFAWCICSTPWSWSSQPPSRPASRPQALNTFRWT